MKESCFFNLPVVNILICTKNRRVIQCEVPFKMVEILEQSLNIFGCRLSTRDCFPQKIMATQSETTVLFKLESTVATSRLVQRSLQQCAIRHMYGGVFWKLWQKKIILVIASSNPNSPIQKLTLFTVCKSIFELLFCYTSHRFHNHVIL